ncbi:hypothetical protein SFMTTN_2082 [Sulfuriferula multivorans]|uniref:Uncharacterized protein n=1 Tax=Sulfuriferula multivorans TaxID=1559896 RepID=A0A401JF58_9PROT|nr:hypothetical protein [Sulfuriferula multivorans]GBL46269.1 hypothetical protein SFMTTN_2082 [Sulfuriferula multivorans]
MHAVDLIYSALDPDNPEYPVLPGDPVDGICCITGQSGPCLPRKSLLGPSFTTGDLLALPGGTQVGVAAYVALKYKWERMGAWICDGKTFRRLDRQGVRAAVLGAVPKRPWAGFATTSYKKHGALLAPVNNRDRNVWLWNVEHIDCSDREQVVELWDALNAALRAGIGRTVIESLDCPAWLLERIGLDVWLAFVRWARPHHKSGLYRFLTYLLPSQEELKSA